MARWEPDARGRLTKAAIDLYAEAGYEDTTVADIAASAGLTERTFFRHFTDKREVLFDGSSSLELAICDAVIAAPDQASPLEVVAAAFAAGTGIFDGRRDFARRRAAIIAANASLQERDLLKLDRLGTAIADALQRRGIAPSAAQLAAGTGLMVFRVAFDQWLTGPADDLADRLRDGFDELQALLASSAPAGRRTAATA